MRMRFDEQLANLKRELIRMGALCEEAIGKAIRALVNADAPLAAEVSELERAIDIKERDIETLCLRLLLHQQPVARDLRQISAALKMITDMERIGDHAEDIAEIIGYLGDRRAGEFALIHDMATATMGMVTRSVDAFVKQDPDIARAVIRSDDYVDQKFDETRKELIARINARAEDGEYAVDILMIAKYFERIGDHAVNVAEWVEYSITGAHNGETLP